MSFRSVILFPSQINCNHAVAATSYSSSQAWLPSLPIATMVAQASSPLPQPILQHVSEPQTSLGATDDSEAASLEWQWEAADGPGPDDPFLECWPESDGEA